MPQITLNTRQYRLGVLVLALLGLVVVLITTSKYGAGVSSDAVRAMSTAEGLLAGRGFTDFVGSAYVLWPPLYPLALAGLSLLTRLDIFHAAWYLNLLLFPLNIWLWGRLFERIFAGKLHYALIAGAGAALSSSMVRIYANVASDPLFVTFLVLFFLSAGDYLGEASSRRLADMSLWAALAMLQRYPGVTLLAVMGLAVLVKRGWKGVPLLLLAGGLAALPLGVWLVGHNLLGHGTLFGTRAYGEMLPLENLSLSMTKVLHWFLPYAPGLKDLLLRPWIVLPAAALILILLNPGRAGGWREWRGLLAGRDAWPPLVFAAAYYLLMAFTVNTIDHRDLTSDRYYIILLPALLVFLLLTWQALVLRRLEGSRWAGAAAALLLLVWFIYPLYDLQEYLQLARVNGEPSNYNIYNSSHFTEMEVVKEGRRLAGEHPGAALYSNYVNLLWFQYKRPIRVLLPVDNSLPPGEREKVLRSEHPGWPGEAPGYLIWFTPNEYKYLAGPEDLGRLAELTLIYRDDHGEIYEVRSRP